jgi:hypothetical protein
MKVGDYIRFQEDENLWQVSAFDPDTKMITMVCNGEIMIIGTWLYEKVGAWIDDGTQREIVIQSPQYDATFEWVGFDKDGKYVNNLENLARFCYDNPEIRYPIEQETCANHWQNPITGVCPDCGQP